MDPGQETQEAFNVRKDTMCPVRRIDNTDVRNQVGVNRMGSHETF